MLKKTSHASFHAHAQLEISIVLPIHNEEETLPTLVERLTSVLEKMELNYELVFVDDGSRDSSWKIIQEFHEATPHRIRGISLSKNFGQHIAVSAGLDSVLGEFAVIMDSDLQDRPEEIPKLYSKIREGFDCVYAIRRNRRDSWFKKLSSKLFYRLNNRLALVQIPENISLFRIINRNFIEHFRQIRESERFIVGLMAWMGFRQVGVEVEHDHRFAGETKYPLSRMIRLAMNNITSLSWRPLQVLTGLGFSIAVACSVVISWLVSRMR
jgi:dolichol-phosphate mannosyltransferase